MLITTAPLRPSRAVRAPQAVPSTTAPALPLLAPDSDRLLVIRSASGDDRAFAEIVRRHGPLLRACALRLLRASSEVDDVVQETFLAAWTHMDSVIDGETIVGWLLTTLRRRCYDRLRSTDHQSRAELEEDLPASLDHSPTAVSERAALVAEARAVLDRMPVLQRRCWELRQLRQLSYDEIGAELGVSATVVRGQLSRARLLMEATLAHWR
ncbi:RNA polymerase sigma factor [Rathayibacter sp. VKM Ac-2760]|uniref:RNA polymerase sigma factor n=1 Tax=Rathayibacter sp. VKM Ac-2760 TaxID=2609253 RepID=UPI00131864BE|nr:RNA polymerase sigma factor [Rathayibacter sp. VKM Ac-2760]QHC58876.1 sigma-70 family RNA polymerase sigma factor [Rathayibacter sp. VKM Ac-2760]